MNRAEAIYLEDLLQQLRQMQRENVALHRIVVDLDRRLSLAGAPNADAELATQSDWLRAYVASARAGITRTPPPRTPRWELEQTEATS